MLQELKVLQEVRVASPCPASWEAMAGNEQVRFCNQCQHHVYNLSAMSAPQAASLVQETEGRLCVRYYARPDGTMLTEDCPVGFHAARRRFLSRLAAALFGLFGLRSLAAAGPAGRPAGSAPRNIQGAPVPPPQHTMGKIAMPAAQPQATMGEMVAPPRPPRATTAAPVHSHQVMGGIDAPMRPNRQPKLAVHVSPKRLRRAKAHARPRGPK